MSGDAENVVMPLLLAANVSRSLHEIGDIAGGVASMVSRYGVLAGSTSCAEAIGQYFHNPHAELCKITRTLLHR